MATTGPMSSGNLEAARRPSSAPFDAPTTPTGGTPGTDYQAIVNTADNLNFRAAFNKPAGGGYQPFLDASGDRIINTADNLQFRSRFNKALTWRV